MRSVGTAAALPLVLQGCGSPGPGLGPTGPGDWDKGIEVTWQPEATLLNETMFPCGLHSGAMRTESAIFWCFAADAAPKRFKCWRPSGETGRVVLVKDAEVTSVDGYIKIQVSGLAPGTRYHYGFFSQDEGERSPLASMRTAIAADSLEPVTVAATTCTNYNHKPYPSLEVAATYEFDVFCQLGDMTYNDGDETLEEFREDWKATLATSGYRAVLSKAGMYATMDDHEISNDSDRYGLPPEVYQAGVDSFFEALAIPEPEPGRFWDSFRWGLTVEFFVLDCRTERDPTSAFSDQETYISRKQMDWLKASLAASPCAFKVILNSVPILGFTDVWPELMDRWQAYPTQRAELLDHIVDESINQVFFLTGDYHLAYTARLEADGPYQAIWEIMVGPGAPRIANPLVNLLDYDPEIRPDFLPEGQFDYFGANHAATLLTFDPAKGSVHVRYIDAQTQETLYEAELKQGLPS